MYKKEEIIQSLDNLFETRILKNLESYSFETIHFVDDKIFNISSQIKCKQGCCFTIEINFEDKNNIKYFVKDVSISDLNSIASVLYNIKNRLFNEEPFIKSIIDKYYF